MIRLLQLATISLLLFSCGQPKKEEAQNDQEKKADDQVSQKLESDTRSAEQEDESKGEDEYKIVFRKIDNRVLLHVADSLIYDSGTIGDNPELEIEFFLTQYVAEGKNEIRIDSYNGVEPYNQADSHWELAYDIYKNDELVEFVREASDTGDVGKVFEETHYLDEFE
ncbi:MAG: hypothetical protein ABJG78_04640 [Cyclobacteriaceae bacterium]